jgi:hypothetical protein
MLKVLVMAAILMKIVVAEDGSLIRHEVMNSTDVAKESHAHFALYKTKFLPLPVGSPQFCTFIVRFDDATGEVTITPDAAISNSEETSMKPLYDVAEWNDALSKLDRRDSDSATLDVDEGGKIRYLSYSRDPNRSFDSSKYREYLREVESAKATPFPSIPFRATVRFNAALSNVGVVLKDREGAPVAITRTSDASMVSVAGINNRGVLAMLHHDRAGAEAAFRKALHDKPDYMPARRNLGLLARWKM